MKPMKTASMRAVLVLCLVVAFGLIGCAGKGAMEKDTCDTSIMLDVTSDVKLTQFDYMLGEHGGQPSLIFTVSLENPTDKPLRYRLNIFLEDMYKAAGHYVPRKGKPAVLQPGKSATVKIPFIKTDKFSKKMLVRVATMQE